MKNPDPNTFEHDLGRNGYYKMANGRTCKILGSTRFQGINWLLGVIFIGEHMVSGDGFATHEPMQWNANTGVERKHREEYTLVEFISGNI